MGFKRFAFVFAGSVVLSVILLNISEAVRERGLEGVVYFTAFCMCIAVVKPAAGENRFRLEGGSAENTFALIFFIAAPFIGSIAWYSTVVVHSWISNQGFPN